MSRLFAALHEESKEGWSWIGRPDLASATVVRIENPRTRATVYCEARFIDDNFLRLYNRPGRTPILDPANALVLNSWYRQKLGGLQLQSDYDLRIRASRGLRSFVHVWRHHPSVFIRVNLVVAAVSVLCSVVGLVLGVLALR